MAARDERFLAEVEAAAEALSHFAHARPAATVQRNDAMRWYLTQHPLDPHQSLREQHTRFAHWARSQHLLPESFTRFSAHVLRRTVVMALAPDHVPATISSVA